MSDSYEKVRDQIIQQIGKTGSEDLRVVMTMMLGVLEHSVQASEEIKDRLDVLLNDGSLRASILNGHADRHHTHHDFIDELMHAEKQREPVCEWAKKKMQEEEAANRIKAQRWNRLVSKIIEHSATIVITGAALYFGFIK